MCAAEDNCTRLSVVQPDGGTSLSGTLDWCTVEGVRGGVLAFEPASGSCRADSDCPTNAACVVPSLSGLEVPGPWSFTRCYATGSCVKNCDMDSTKQKLKELNAGIVTCTPDDGSSSGQCAADEYCAATTSATCNTWVCDPVTQSLVKSACPGMCQPQRLGLLSAVLSNNGRSVNVALNAPAAPLSLVSCGRMFDSNNMAQLGGAAATCSVNETTLTIDLGAGATLVADGVLKLLESGSILTWKFNTTRSFNGSVTVRTHQRVLCKDALARLID
ncbi:hypothetical protein PLESTB_000450500 [Pleodorina starrii]|uniref:Uncharacterized protein n=1 Tax=Pleodorina starrii TaxID=330485 RepID=A0A9W6F046_9CHLO|nr:hypothetical protein PLESTM_000752000 [Pleodorina starrii]GLC50955.1 hypothetical protein PLESTB_000450500 [Pleodorina starrii]